MQFKRAEKRSARGRKAAPSLTSLTSQSPGPVIITFQSVRPTGAARGDGPPSLGTRRRAATRPRQIPEGRAALPSTARRQGVIGSAAEEEESGGRLVGPASTDAPGAAARMIRAGRRPPAGSNRAPVRAAGPASRPRYDIEFAENKPEPAGRK